MIQEQLKEQKRRQLMHVKRKSSHGYQSDEDDSFVQMPEESSESEDSDHSRMDTQCGECSGCLRHEDCLECEVCLVSDFLTNSYKSHFLCLK